jgi:hypothetical protein
MVSFRSAVATTVYLAMLLGCGSHSPPNDLPASSTVLAVPVFVTNESMLTRRFELLVNGVVVLDTVVARPLDLTGRVLLETVRLVPGDHQLVLVDHHQNRRFTTRLTARPGGMCIFISLMGPRTDFHAGNYICHFA